MTLCKHRLGSATTPPPYPLPTHPCSIKTRELLGNPSPVPKRFPETREMSSRVEGNIEDRGDGFPNNSLVLVEQGCILYTVYSTSISDSICEEGEHGINSFNFVLFGRLLGVLFQTFHIYWRGFQSRYLFKIHWSRQLIWKFNQSSFLQQKLRWEINLPQAAMKS